MSQIKRLQPLVKRPFGNSYGVTNSYAFEKALLHKAVCLCPADAYSLKLFTSRLKAFMPSVLMNTSRTVDFFSVLSPFFTICSSYL